MNNKSSDITVGILIPTYNRPYMLDVCVISALAQSYPNIKIVLIDNGQQDGKIKNLYENKDERLTYIGNENNIGLIGSINKGIELMPKEVTWCTVLCDDDALHEDYVKEALQAISDHNAKSIVDCHRIFIDKDGNKISDAMPAASEISATEYIEKRLTAARQTYLTGVLFNRYIFEKIGGYPRFTTGMASDDAFIFSLSINDRLIYNHKAKAYIRIHERAESNALENISLILKTISEYKLYCQNKTKDIAFSSQKDADAFIRVLNRYVIRLNSSCWLKKSHDILFSQQPNKRDLLSDLCKIAKNDNFLFSHRVYFNRFLFEKFGLFPETSLVFRMLWDLIAGDLKIFGIRRFQ